MWKNVAKYLPQVAVGKSNFAFTVSHCDVQSKHKIGKVFSDDRERILSIL